MRVGLICMYDPEAPDRLSGMGESVQRQFARLGWETVPLYPKRQLSRLARWRQGAKDHVMRRLNDDGLDRTRRLKAGLDRLRHRRRDRASDYAATLASARLLSAEIARQADAADVDVLFACLGSALLYASPLPRPLVYFSDTTVALAEAGYPKLRDRSLGYRAACREIETSAIARADATIMAFDGATRSAIQDHNGDPQRVTTIPMGANVTPDPSIDQARFDPDPPCRKHLNLLITARSPRRKRVGLAIETLGILRDRGWNATLTYIGPKLRAYRRHAHVHCAGSLQLSSPQDRRQHHALLERCHLMILPSAGEAFGIATAEAAHWGKPSVVSDAGGLPESVLDGETGRVVPVDAPAAAYADAVVELADDRGAYRRMARAALRRAQAQLTWDHWGDRVAEIVTRVVDTVPLSRPVTAATTAPLVGAVTQ